MKHNGLMNKPSDDWAPVPALLASLRGFSLLMPRSLIKGSIGLGFFRSAQQLTLLRS